MGRFPNVEESCSKSKEQNYQPFQIPFSIGTKTMNKINSKKDKLNVPTVSKMASNINGLQLLEQLKH